MQVADRDGELMKAKTDLNTILEQYKGTNEENEMHVAEIGRLNAKMKQLNLDLKDASEKLEAQALQVKLLWQLPMPFAGDFPVLKSTKNILQL